MADTTNWKVIAFCPENWSALERFRHFYFNTYPFPRHMQNVINGAANHYVKALRLTEIAQGFSTTLAEDETELKERGYTNQKRGLELSAIIESVILELYSSLDCTRAIISKMYENHRGVRNSTHKLFKAMFENRVAETVPFEIRGAFGATSSWYPEFLKIRDALTHSDIGLCRLSNNKKVIYMNLGTGDGRRPFIKEDIFQYLDTLQRQVNEFNESIFAYLNTTLRNEEVQQTCGVFGGFVYTRRIKPNETIDFNSGRCNNWFDSPGKPRCPFADTCGAHNAGSPML